MSRDEQDWRRIAMALRLNAVIRDQRRYPGPEVYCIPCGAEGESGHNLPHRPDCPVGQFDAAQTAWREARR